MKCEKCGMKLPNDSEFCQYCGQPVKEKTDDNEAIVAEPIIEQLPVSNESAEPPIESPDIKSTSNEAVAVVEEYQKKRRYHKERKEKPTVFCKKCGNPLDPSTKKCSSCGAQPFFRKHRSLMPIVALSIVAAILLGLCISLFILSNTKDEKITDLESKVRSLESQARINNNTMDRLRDNNETLQENSDIFDSLCNYGSFGSFGYAANNFHTNTGLIVMTENSTKSFTAYGETIS